MKKPSHDVLLFSLVMFMGVLVLACATKSYINVNYQIPLSSYDLKGEKIFLEIKDMRPDKTIFSEKAKNKFKNFTGLFLFSLSQGEKKNYVVGAFDLPSLFKAAFSRRLENLGIVMLKEAETTEPVIEIDLQKFFLDLVDRSFKEYLRSRLTPCKALDGFRANLRALSKEISSSFSKGTTSFTMPSFSAS